MEGELPPICCVIAVAEGLHAERGFPLYFGPPNRSTNWSEWGDLNSRPPAPNKFSLHYALLFNHASRTRGL